MGMSKMIPMKRKTLSEVITELVLSGHRLEIYSGSGGDVKVEVWKGLVVKGLLFGSNGFCGDDDWRLQLTCAREAISRKEKEIMEEGEAK